jgi:hypothetical protein
MRKKSKGKKTSIEETLILFFAEMIAAGIRREQFRFAARILSAVKRTYRINFAGAIAIFIYA